MAQIEFNFVFYDRLFIYHSILSSGIRKVYKVVKIECNLVFYDTETTNIYNFILWIRKLETAEVAQIEFKNLKLYSDTNTTDCLFTIQC